MDFSLHMIIFRERIREAGYAECVEYTYSTNIERTRKVRIFREHEAPIDIIIYKMYNVQVCELIFC